MSIVRSAERILLLVGLVFLSIWGTAKLHSMLGSRAAISRFRAAEAMKSSANTFSSEDPVTGARVDFHLWSPQRITGYRNSFTREEVPLLAILRIPRINLEVPVFDGTDDVTLNRGVGRISGTAQVGQSGNLGIAGHRDGFFRGLQNIVKGDVVELDRPEARSRYVVSQIDVVTPQDTQVLNPTPAPTLTLVTCFPFYFIGAAPKRFVVRAVLEDYSQSDIDKNRNSGHARN
jgi:sortase A